jgi:glutathione S-transferase
MAVMMVAAHLGIELETEFVDLLRDVQHSAKFLAINPNGLVPVLQDGDFILWESSAITQYLAKTKPGNALWPANERDRADIARWQFWSHLHWMPALGPFLFENMFKKIKGKGDPDPAVLAQAQHTFDSAARVLDTHLKDRRFLVGANMTLADISVASWLMYAEPARIPLDAYPAIRRWLGGIQAMPAWQQAQPSAGVFKPQSEPRQAGTPATAA